MIRSIAVVGVGGVGGFFGGKLCQLIPLGIHVSFVARGEHLRAIQEHGLILSTEAEGEQVVRPSMVTDEIGALMKPDLVLLCVKEFDLATVLEGLRPMVNENTVILPLLNGMDVYSRVRRVIAKGVVLPACVYVGTHIERPGKVRQRGGACQVLFGLDPLRTEFKAAEILQAFQGARIKCELTGRVQDEIWTKFIFICGYGTVTAAYNKTVGEVFANDALRKEVQEIMREAVAVAKAVGVELPKEIVQNSLAKAKSFPFETKTSFQRDFERPDRRDERNLFARALIERAKEGKVAVPKTEELLRRLNSLKPLL